jgi:rhodanese-related sulfurtransferase
MNRAGQSALVQQGYDYSADDLRELEWGLRFTPTICMAVAVVGLVLREPVIHYVLAALGMLPFWFPAWHPVDVFYNQILRPLWGGVRLPPNPLPRRIACFMGGAMNLGIGIAFALGSPPVAYVLGAILIGLQLIVISTHFCLASWMYERLLLALGRWDPPVPVETARKLIESGAEVIDLRSPGEFAAGHLPGAKNVPLESVAKVLSTGPDACYVVYCRSGLQSQRAAQILKRRGGCSVHNLGGMNRLEGLTAPSPTVPSPPAPTR